MSIVEIEFGANLPEEDRLYLTEDDLIRHSPVKTHTGKADMTATVVGNPDLKPYAQRQDRINVRYNDSTEWTGYLTNVADDPSRGTTRIQADGVEKRLEETRPDYDALGGPVTYNNVALHDALRDYWARTPFDNVTVTDQSTELVAEDDTIHEIDTQEEWESVLGDYIDDKNHPVDVVDGHLTLLQTCFVDDIPDGGTRDVSDDDFSDGVGAYLEGASEYIIWDGFGELNYTIPAEYVGVGYRVNADDSIGYDVSLNGETIHSFGSIGHGSLSWFDLNTFTDIAFDVSDASQIVLESTDGADSPVNFDCAVIYDMRYHDMGGWDNEVHEPGGYLDSPALYPEDITVRSDSLATSYNVSNITVNSSWNNVEGEQAISVSHNAGETFVSQSNTDTYNKDFDTPGREIIVDFTLSRYGNRDTATPRFGFEGQRIDSYSITVDGDDLIVLTDLELSRNHFDNLSTLHSYGNFLYVIEHDDGPIEDLVVSSFQRGDETRPAPDGFDNPINKQPEIQSGTYFNSIYLEGKIREDGTRPSAEVKDDDAIGTDGREISPGVLRDLDISTEPGAVYRARALLETSLQNNDLVGSIRVPATITDPGYSRPVTLSDQEGEVHKTVEEVSLNLGTDSAEATFDFSVRSGLSEDIADLRRNAKSVSNQV